MGSRAVIVLGRDADAARQRFGVRDDKAGVIYTRTGRAFFSEETLERRPIEQIGGAIETAGLWNRLATDWLCLDAELMPWSAKAQALIDSQYRPVGEAGIAGLNAAVELLAQAAGRGVEVGEFAAHLTTRSKNAAAYDASWRRYVRPIAGIEDLRIAPFHLLASEGSVHIDKAHDWHMGLMAELATALPSLLIATPYHVVDINDFGRTEAATSWWDELTNAGGEGMVVKPLDFVVHGKKGIVQPAIKCRGREYLRIIYGPDYTMPAHLDRLRERGLAHV